MSEQTKITVDQAVSAIRADYYTDVREHAASFAQEHADEFDAETGEITGDIEDALHESIDGCSRVIYTYQARLGLLVSDNEDAWEEYGFETPTIEQRMYCAMMADVRDYLSDTDFVLEALKGGK